MNEKTYMARGGAEAARELPKQKPDQQADTGENQDPRVGYVVGSHEDAPAFDTLVPYDAEADEVPVPGLVDMAAFWGEGGEEGSPYNMEGARPAEPLRAKAAREAREAAAKEQQDILINQAYLTILDSLKWEEKVESKEELSEDEKDTRFARVLNEGNWDFLFDTRSEITARLRLRVALDVPYEYNFGVEEPVFPLTSVAKGEELRKTELEAANHLIASLRTVGAEHAAQQLESSLAQYRQFYS